jgi:arylsulfatase A-like enzyme
MIANKNSPFFIYIPHSMPHIPLYVPDEVRDPDPKNAYFNTIEHIDSEVGRILKTLDELKLTEKTYVIYTTDNGPWLSFRHHGGSAGPLRDGKGTTFEGGQRVPCVMRGPGIPAGTECGDLMGTIDLLPTFASITGRALPKGRKVDGVDATSLLTGKGSPPRSEFIHYTSRGEVEGIRQRNWKLLIKNKRGKASGTAEVLLFDLKKDLGEKNNLASQKPKIVEKLKSRMLQVDSEITQNARLPWMME